MLKVKGFVEIQSLINLSTGTISPLGEMSTVSQTYTNQLGKFSDPSIPGFNLNVTCSVNTSGVIQQITQAVATHILTISNWLVTYASQSAQLTGYPAINLLNSLELAQATSMANISCGNIVTNGSIWMPEWVSWTNINITDANSPYVIKVWFSDNSFQSEYDEFSITVVPPVASVDDFFQTPSLFEAEINSITPSQVMTAVSSAKGKNPETYLEVVTFPYVIPNSTLTVPTNWYVLIYGIAGNNTDSIKQAIISYIAKNSTRTQAQWQVILPSLFTNTEFTIVPRWDKIAIPNLSIQTGLYSPIVSPNECIGFATTNIPNYSSTQISSYLQIVSSNYKSLMLLVVGGPTNVNSQYLLSGLFPDYTDLGTNSTDFARMSTTTQQWCLLLNQLLLAAETMTASSDIPTGLQRIVRNNFIYASAQFNNVQYLVSAKINFPGV